MRLILPMRSAATSGRVMRLHPRLFGYAAPTGDSAWRLPCYVAGMALVATGIVVLQAFQASGTADELAHLASALCHWRLGRFDIYDVNPPIQRLVASFPVEMLGLVPESLDIRADTYGRPEFQLGEELARVLGQRIVTVLGVARTAALVFYWLGAWATFQLARSLSGGLAGAFAAAMFLLSPNMMGHAPLITPDVAAASLGALAVWLCSQWLQDRNILRSIASGFALGAAMGAKGTLLLLPIIFAAFAVKRFAALLSDPGGVGLRQSIARFSVNFGVLVLASWVTISAVYGFRGLLYPLGAFEFRSVQLAGLTIGPETNPSSTRISGSGFANRFRETALARLPTALPRDYVQGVDRQWVSFSANRPAYLHGEWRVGHGWWYYYLYAALVKMPVGYLLLILLATARVAVMDKARGDVSFLIAVILILWIVVSSHTGINRHFRYIFPALPLMFAFAAHLVGRNSTPRWRRTAVSLLLVGIVESLWCAPHGIAFFNCLVGGPLNGRQHLLGSNLDWGQDVLRLTRWQQAQPDDRQPLAAVLNAPFDPENIGLMFYLPTVYERESAAHLSHSKYCALSVNFIAGRNTGARTGSGHYGHTESDVWTHLDDLKPVYRIGYSILVFRSDQVLKHLQDKGVFLPGYGVKQYKEHL